MAKGGERVGEATSAVIPWPHQVRAFERLYRNWPPRLLIADESVSEKPFRPACCCAKLARPAVPSGF